MSHCFLHGTPWERITKFHMQNGRNGKNIQGNRTVGGSGNDSMDSFSLAFQVIHINHN